MRKKRKDTDEDEETMEPWDDFFDDDYIGREFDDYIEREFERIHTIFDRLRENFEKDDDRFFRSSPIIYGFSFKLGPDGKPVIQRFGNLPGIVGMRTIDERMGALPREPLTDVVDGKDSFSVTLELPGVEKDDIDISISGGILKVKVDAPNRKYAKEIELPRDVDEASAKASFRNGVLDITFQKKKGEKESGKKIPIQ
ncbi:MAG: archaeal heat shock protein Hsp20 [Thermoplasmata archaeon]